MRRRRPGIQIRSREANVTPPPANFHGWPLKGLFDDCVPMLWALLEVDAVSVKTDVPFAPELSVIVAGTNVALAFSVLELADSETVPAKLYKELTV